MKSSHLEMTQRFDQLKLDSNINDDNQENIPLIENIILPKKVIRKQGYRILGGILEFFRISLQINPTIMENSKPKRKINNPSTHLYTSAGNIKKKLELLRIKLVEEEKRNRVFHSKPAPKFISKPQAIRVKEETTKRKNLETPDVLKPIAERRKKMEVKKPIFDPTAQIITRFTKSSDFIKTEKKKTCLSRETINAIPPMTKTAAPKITKPAILPRVTKTAELRSSIKTAMVPKVNKVDIPKSKLSKDPVEPKVSKTVQVIRSASAPTIVAPKSTNSTTSKVRKALTGLSNCIKLCNNIFSESEYDQSKAIRIYSQSL